jgi:hypothetical protein
MEEDKAKRFPKQESFRTRVEVLADPIAVVNNSGRGEHKTGCLQAKKWGSEDPHIEATEAISSSEIRINAVRLHPARHQYPSGD